MMDALLSWAIDYPWLAGTLFAWAWFTAGLFVSLLFGLSRMPPELMDATLGDEDDSPASPAAPMIWNRSGGNWWLK